MLQFYQNFVKVFITKNVVLLIIIKHIFDMIFILEKNYAPPPYLSLGSLYYYCKKKLYLKSLF